jgi:hypothetical protein
LIALLELEEIVGLFIALLELEEIVGQPDKTNTEEVCPPAYQKSQLYTAQRKMKKVAISP